MAEVRRVAHRTGRLPAAAFAAALPLAAALGCANPAASGPAPPAGAIVAGSDAGWRARAQAHIAEREYHASESAEGFQAPNRAHGLRTTFAPTGIRVHDRTPGKGLEPLRLSLAGLGRGDALEAVPAGGELVADGSRVEIHRPGLVEWYLNSPAGLEQGFTLADRPQGEGPLVVELAVAGARPALRDEAIVFETQAQRNSPMAGSPRAMPRAGRSPPTSSSRRQSACASSSTTRARATRW